MPVILSDPAAANKTVVLARSMFDNLIYSTENDDPLHPAQNAVTDDTYSYWAQASGAATRLIKSGAATTASANACGIGGHNLGTTGARLYIQSSPNLVDWTNVVPSYAPLSDENLLFIFPQQTHLHWRVVFGETTGAYVSNVKLGVRLDFPCTPVMGYTPTHHSKRYTKYFNNSMGGHLLGNRVMAAGGETTVEFPEIPRSFVDGPLPAFKDHYDRGRAFFYAGWPAGKPQDIAYASADGEDAVVDVTYTGGDRLATVGFGMSLYYGA